MVLFSGGGDSRVSFSQNKQTQYLVSTVNSILFLIVANLIL